MALGAAGGLLAFLIAESRLPALHAWITEDPAQVQTRLKLIASGLAAAVAVPTLQGMAVILSFVVDGFVTILWRLISLFRSRST